MVDLILKMRNAWLQFTEVLYKCISQPLVDSEMFMDPVQVFFRPMFPDDRVVAHAF